MALPPGTTLGGSKILALLGAGGMGEVLRAHDTKLGRDVAIKILPESVAADPERLARFEREARVLASPNHPTVADIYGLEDAGGSRALVLELVEGETLAERIAGQSKDSPMPGSGSPMPLADGATTSLSMLPTDGGPMRPLTDFGERSIVIARRVAWSPDGQSLYAAVSETNADIVLLDGVL